MLHIMCHVITTYKFLSFDAQNILPNHMELGKTITGVWEIG